VGDKRRMRLTGLGFAVGGDVRTNEDPIFDWLRSHDVSNRDLFSGYVDRAVLKPDETIEGLMVRAASDALDEANLKATDIDVLIGYASVSKYVTPNALTAVHRDLKMRSDCWLMPVQSEYTNYLVAIRLANALIASGEARNVLVSCGANWTRYVDYHQAASISVGDGACAAVVSESNDGSRFHLADAATRCATKWYGAMDMSPRQMIAEDDPSAESPFIRLGAYSKPVFNLDPERGGKAFKEFGEKAPPELALQLLEKNNVSPDQVTVISHQASGVLLDAWRKAIEPKSYLDTMARFGNMTLASMGVTFACKYDKIDTAYLLLLGIGIQQETTALLLEREHK